MNSSKYIGFTFDSDDLDLLFHKIREYHEVLGPKKGDLIKFELLESAEELDLTYTQTIFPPKTALLPMREKILSFVDDNIICVTPSTKRTMLFGVHPCDVQAILRQDEFFSKDFQDPYYLKRRCQTVILALNCVEVGENCFCHSFGIGPSISTGYDLLLTDIGDRYIVEIGSEAGQTILNNLHLKVAKKEDFVLKEEKLDEARQRFVKSIDISGLVELVRRSKDHDVWTALADTGGVGGSYPCLSCGSCSLVCPTCYCYDVLENFELSLKKGERWRELDSCQILEYSEMALGSNPKRNRSQRIRHWMSCKFGAAAGGLLSACVGCGRCIMDCPVHIDITIVAKKLRDDLP
ncbi:MAG: hypothetical protein GTN80_10370 [Nitrososphaeria archaeon]|nr:hypothetical protein [Nitrososphaeria archaeon]NIN53515.1 hypothetical protein [Nitrososphaeria archaeon]NIQ34026.1 hypothetical protein [Nitrososphaeria archaeon]